MSDLKPVIVIEDDPLAQNALEAAVAHHMGDKRAEICSAEGLPTDVNERAVLALGEAATDFAEVSRLSKPVRVGAVLDLILRLEKKQRAQSSAEHIHLGAWILDPVHNLLNSAKGDLEPVRLTEKEADILVLLHNNTEQSVSRDDMLQKVWGFVDGVETHTLETHIYRLRQKIEADPAAPQILITTDAGYTLKVD
ncbi:MAG: winged helix-turn-helix domain-containing protein [Pseudomonadota bacterium]